MKNHAGNTRNYSEEAQTRQRDKSMERGNSKNINKYFLIQDNWCAVSLLSCMSSEGVFSVKLSQMKDSAVRMLQRCLNNFDKLVSLGIINMTSSHSRGVKPLTD